ncbi:MAG: class I mannose-6-phosphate isomerase [Planctomycetota bacterium]|nr:class I mannose-6-phosphate isomerase [Acidimicrobiales bacterium]MDA0254148.1 class I mannose-6-phosphate isomerase [Planctomycetota bacterium]MDA1202671.1 class I mannose-6-phosphate isomerase [Planctomycetota bacterium]
MLPPLIFTPLYRRYIWGGRRFAAAFGRELPTGDDYAESWELVDREDDQSIVRAGPLAGRSLRAIVEEQGEDLFGHPPPPAFPLLFKFLDANRVLSVQVHPDDARAARLSPPDRGKTEAWYVVAAEPESRIYAGLREGVGPADLAAAIRAGACEEVLHAFQPAAGDCIFIPAGTVHAIGAGLLVAEIQQSSDVTYRLFDWNRTDADGRPRPLHIEAGVEAVTQTGPVGPVAARPSNDPAVRSLVACDYFGLDEVQPGPAWRCGGGGRCQFLAVLEGRIGLPERWGLPDLRAGDCVLLPAVTGEQELTAASGTRLLRVTVP